MSDYCEHCQRFDEQHAHQHRINTEQAKEIEQLKEQIAKLEKVQEVSQKILDRVKPPWWVHLGDALAACEEKETP